MKMYVSQTTQGFYAEGVSILPEDAHEIDIAEWQSLVAGQAEGKRIDFTTLPPCLKEREITRDDEIMLAEQKRAQLIDNANTVMNNSQWPGKAALGRLKENERVSYGVWLDYLEALEAVDTSRAPDITWPEPPARSGE
ncbi:tail fiber assembly protein [Cronobacter sakazakii]|nr:tail fiber assembly protein [Cronobacter sakazakii]ELY6428649.1 tail fiber assembly protein [Cronobacter sakazakii]